MGRAATTRPDPAGAGPGWPCGRGRPATARAGQPPARRFGRVGEAACAALLLLALVLALAGCAPSGGEAAGSGEPGFRDADLGIGWRPVESMPLERATCFTVDYYDGGYKLVCVRDGGRYLVVPQDAPVPDGLADDVAVLQQPLGDVYLAASDAMCLFDALGAIDSITVSGIAQENWSVKAAVEAMRSGAIAYGGKYSAPDYDLLLSAGVRLAVESTMINHTPDVREKLVELGIPVLTEMSSYEPDPLGRTEWVKLYGALLNREDLADELFERQVAAARSVEGAATGKTVAYFYINSGGSAVVRKPGDYVTRMIAMAGGDYVFTDLGDDSATSTVTMEMERFYAEARDADVVIYNATIDSGVESLSDLVAKNVLIGNFRAVRAGDVWVTEQNMYQQMMNTGDIIADFNAVLTGRGADCTYLRKLV